MTFRMVNTEKAPKAIGPYSQAVHAGDFLFCSGQIPIDRKTGKLELFGGDAAKQARLVLDNLDAVLGSEGLTFDSVVKTTIYLSDMEDFSAVNEVYATYFNTYRPARACVAVATLPKGADVEIDAIAYVG